MLVDPLSHNDAQTQGEAFAKEVIARQYFTGNPPIIKGTISSARTGEESTEQIPITDEMASLASLKESGWTNAGVYICDEEGNQISSTYEPITVYLRNFEMVYHYIDALENQRELLHEFEPGFLDDITETVDQIALNCYKQLRENASGVELDVEKTNSTDEVTRAIFDCFTSYENMKSDLTELDKIAQRLNQVRDDTVSAGIA